MALLSSDFRKVALILKGPVGFVPKKNFHGPSSPYAVRWISPRLGGSGGPSGRAGEAIDDSHSVLLTTRLAPRNETRETDETDETK